MTFHEMITRQYDKTMKGIKDLEGRIKYLESVKDAQRDELMLAHQNIDKLLIACKEAINAIGGLCDVEDCVLCRALEKLQSVTSEVEEDTDA